MYYKGQWRLLASNLKPVFKAHTCAVKASGDNETPRAPTTISFISFIHELTPHVKQFKVYRVAHLTCQKRDQ